jgi:hypothetical protein
MTYGGQDLVFNNIPGSQEFKAITSSDNVISIPNNDIYTNKSLYAI